MSDKDLILDPAIFRKEDLSFEPWQLRPKTDWAVVCQEQRKTTMKSGLIIPMETNHEKLHEGTGYIIRLTAGPIAMANGLEKGQRVMYRTYLRHAQKLETSACYADGTKREYFLISLADVTAVLDEDVEVGLLSEKK
jgi:co-chaperonin GroES (HSP10)